MADIQYDTVQYPQTPQPNIKRSWLAKLIIKAGLAKDDAGAQKVLWVILVILLLGIAAIWLL